MTIDLPSTISKKFLALFSVITMVIVTPTSQAFAHDMCFDNEFNQEKLRYETEVGWGKPHLFDPNPEEVTANVNSEELIGVLRNLEDGWKTPSSIWPKSAVIIRIFHGYTLKCQAIYSKDEIFAMDSDLNGFLRRPLSVADYFALDKALDLNQKTRTAQ